MGIVEGDIATDLDAARLAGRGAQISLLNTDNGFGGECHLDAPMVNRALDGLDLSTLDLVIIENVGNLVCPAEFDVGEHAKVMVYSLTEGEDKPLKYPVMFRAVDVVLLNKIDLAPTSMPTWRPTPSGSGRSIRLPRCCPSARRPVRVCRSGSAGCAPSPAADTATAARHLAGARRSTTSACRPRPHRR